MRRRRFRKWARWACTVAAGAALALAVFSRFYQFEWTVARDSGRLALLSKLGSGVVSSYFFQREDPSDRVSGWSWAMQRWSGWSWGLSEDPSSTGRGWHAGLYFDRNSSGSVVGVSLMYPVAITLIPAALLWYADRRRFGPHQCGRCGYNRAGLAADTKCPECGVVPKT